MLNKRGILIGAATAACALGIGFLMQPSTFGPAAGGNTGAAQAGLELRQEPTVSSPVSIEKITLTSVKPGLSPADPARGERTAGGAGAVASGRPSLVAACDLSARATALAGALVQLEITAPCRGGQRITLHHHGMMITETLDDKGALDLVVPALSARATFIVEPVDLVTTSEAAAVMAAAVAQVDVPDMGQVDRVVLQWRGNSGFEIHAREFGAQYGENGHVWHGADPALGGEGQLLRLGDPDQLVPRLAEIYSFRHDASTSAVEGGLIEISVEAEITQINCGREIAAQSLRVVAGRVQTRDLVLNMPDCTASGDFLVLNNLVENLKIAAK